MFYTRKVNDCGFHFLMLMTMALGSTCLLEGVANGQAEPSITADVDENGELLSLKIGEQELISAPAKRLQESMFQAAKSDIRRVITVPDNIPLAQLFSDNQATDSLERSSRERFLEMFSKGWSECLGQARDLRNISATDLRPTWRSPIYVDSIEEFGRIMGFQECKVRISVLERIYQPSLIREIIRELQPTIIEETKVDPND